MILASESSQYIIPCTAAPYGTECSLCKTVIANINDRMQETGQLVLVSSIEAEGSTYVSHTHIDCMQDLVAGIPSIFSEFEDLRNSYLQGVA